VPGLVNHLIYRLVEHQSSQQRAVGLRIHAASLGVALAERRLTALHPLVGEVAELLAVRAVEQLMTGSVVERAQHAGHVAQRDRRRPALLERNRWLPLEIQNHPAGRRAKHLAEVIVAVHPLHRNGPAGGGEVGVVAADLGGI
jgi:hypothetical protein